MRVFLYPGAGQVLFITLAFGISTAPTFYQTVNQPLMDITRERFMFNYRKNKVDMSENLDEFADKPLEELERIVWFKPLESSVRSGRARLALKARHDELDIQSSPLNDI